MHYVWWPAVIFCTVVHTILSVPVSCYNSLNWKLACEKWQSQRATRRRTTAISGTFLCGVRRALAKACSPRYVYINRCIIWYLRQVILSLCVFANLQVESYVYVMHIS